MWQVFTAIPAGTRRNVSWSLCKVLCLWLLGLKKIGMCWRSLKKLITSLQRFSGVYTWTDGRKDRMYMISVFLQHFAVTRHTTSASFLGFMDLKECKYEIFRKIFRVGEVSFWQPFRYETDAGCDRDMHSSGAQTHFVGSSCQQVAFEISSSSPGAWW